MVIFEKKSEILNFLSVDLLDKKTGKISHSVGDDTIFEAFLDGSQPNMFEATDRSDNNRSNNFRKGL